MGKQQKNQQKKNFNKNNGMKPVQNNNQNQKNQKSKLISKQNGQKNNNVQNNSKNQKNNKSQNQAVSRDNNKNKSAGQSKNSNNQSTKLPKPSSGIQNDSRFAKAAYDPRFLRPKKQITKVKIDDRFSKMLTDPAFKNTTKVDKYGRKIQQEQKKQNQQLKQYYQFDQGQNDQEQDEEMENDEEMMDQEKMGSQEQEQIDGEENQDQDNNQNQQQQQQQDERTNIRKWMQQYDEQSSSLADMPVEQLIQQENQGPQVWSDDQQNLIKNEKVKATKRLALCNYDWMNIASKDLMILFNSFKSASGYIKSIKVYQSNLGKEKMEEQEKYGPQGIWNDNQDDQFVNADNSKGKKWRKTWKELLKRQDSSALDSRKLRAYQKERLKYFYAVIQCDSKKTADQIYKQCDGNQFEHSNLQFDLRFIPDDISFDKSMLKQQCDQMPVAGQVKNFVNRAMGHSKVQLTWQDPQLSLAAGLKKKNWGKMTQQQLNKIDWSTYLNQEDVQDDENKKQLFLEKQQEEVIPDWKKQCNKKFKRQNQKEKLVISFDSGFGPSKSNNKKSPAIQQVPSLKKQKKTKKQLRQRAEQQRKKRRDDLALIAQDKGQQQRQKNFRPDLKDQRFTAVYNNPLFSIDPSNPKFDHRKAGNIFKEVVQRNKSKNLL